MSDTVMVIGGGIAGIQASLDLANAGAKVVLIERESTIGGLMAVLDKNFPTLDCSICIEAPKMSEVDLHPNIEIYSQAEVISVRGVLPKFTAEVRQRGRYITSECTRCGDCTTACPVLLPNSFDAGLGSRKAIYSPIPQSVPGTYTIDIDQCLNDPPNYLPCSRCIDACKPGAIDFLMPKMRRLSFNVAAIIVAVGYNMLDPRRIKEFGYGSHPDILTALEFERLINSAGPTAGELICPSDGRHPKSGLFVLCVGSRDRRYFQHCSRFCCMYSLKHAYQALDHGMEDITVMHMDIRAYGKGFDGFLDRVRGNGAKFIRGRPSIIRGGPEGVSVVFEDIDKRRRKEQLFDLVILANAVTPARGLPSLANILGLEIDDDGFIKVDELRGGLVASTRPGIYIAGCASGPKDIPDSVAEGSGAAGLAMGHLQGRHWPSLSADGKRNYKPSDQEAARVGVFVCHCGSNIAGVINVEEVVSQAAKIPGVVHVGSQMFSCAGNTQAEIEKSIKEANINRLVIAACSPKTHEAIFRGVLDRAGLNPYLVEMANIRNMDSWVHKADPEAATRKAIDMVSMAVEKASRLLPLEGKTLPVAKRIMIVGGGIAGMTAAASLARQGFETHLIERQSHLGGLLDKLDIIAPTGKSAVDYLVPIALELIENKVNVHLGVEVKRVTGVVGNFEVCLSDDCFLKVGAIIMAVGALPFQPNGFNYHTDPRVITNLELEQILIEEEISGERITFISCIGSRDERMGCSRYCCTSMVNQASRLQKQGNSVRIINRDIRTYSRQAEELYEEAMRVGVRFFRVDQEYPTHRSVSYDDGLVELYDIFLGRTVRFETDRLVLVTGLRPSANGLSDQLKLARSEDGFLMELHPKLGPAETSSPGIFLAGTAQGAKDVRESVAQALAAAAKAGALLSKGIIDKEPLTAQLNLELCNGCMRCVKACPYGAIEQIGSAGKDGKVAIHEAACMGCGTCAAECNFDAIDMPFFTKDQLTAQIEAALAHKPETKCIVFACNWCSYAGADLAGIEKRQYPTSARLIRTMCSARIEESFVAHCFERGAGAVLVTGCRLTDTGSDCHYNYANRLTLKRFKYWQRKFQRKGIEPERLQLEWISAAEGKEFAEKIKEMDEVIQRHLMAEEHAVAG